MRVWNKLSMSSYCQRMMGSIKGGMPHIFVAWRNAGFKEIIELAKAGIDEETIFDKYRVKPHQRERIKKHPDWRENYDCGFAEFKINIQKAANQQGIVDNKGIITKELANKFLGYTEKDDIKQKIEIIIDAPEWARKKQNKGAKGERKK